jgi:hypothetical protein
MPEVPFRCNVMCASVVSPLRRNAFVHPLVYCLPSAQRVYAPEKTLVDCFRYRNQIGMERVFREGCAADIEPDGIVFDPAMVKTERIKEDADYEGVRVRFVGLLGKARVSMQIDVGFGDVVTPGAQSISSRFIGARAPAASGPRARAIAVLRRWPPLPAGTRRSPPACRR